MGHIPSEEVAKSILGKEVPSRLGTYRLESWRGQRGRGHVFYGTHLETGQPITIKVYWLPTAELSPESVQQRRQAFIQLTAIRPVDQAGSDFRVLWPNTTSLGPENSEECYLISPRRAASPTLRQIIATQGSRPPHEVRNILAQVLQTLEFLHQSTFLWGEDNLLSGLVHGSISLDSLLWIEAAESTFIYLCDLELWEHLFDPPALKPQYHTIAQDLSQLGIVGLQLLGHPEAASNWRRPQLWPHQDPPLEGFIQRLLALAPPFTDASSARQELLKLPPPAPAVPRSPAMPAHQPATAAPRRWRWGLGLGGATVALLGLLAWQLWPRPQLQAVSPEPRECCLDAISGVPAGRFAYTAITGSRWSEVMAEAESTTADGAAEGLMALAAAQPQLQLKLQSVDSLNAALEKVQSRETAFAILPLLDRPLPAELTAEIIAYDGIALVVPTISGPLPQSLPQALNGSLTLDQVRQLYRGEVANWQVLGGPDLPVRLFAPADQEALSMFQLLAADPTQPPQEQAGVSVQLEPPERMVRSQVTLLETQGIGGIGFNTFSRLKDECAVYPLALASSGPVSQPLVQPSGQPITPRTDLCTGNQYTTDLQVLASGQYPLAYPVAVVYAQDNSLPPVGQKFAELMQTVEGQQFLAEQGWTPLLVDSPAAP